MIIKITADLRKLLKANDGVLKIGDLEIKGTEVGDIDVYLKDKIIYWLSAKPEDEHTILLENVEGTVSTDLQALWNQEQAERDFEREKKVLLKKVEDAEKIALDSKLAVGKVEAYEKILIGREVTISA